jgi:hypothetical protein
MKLSSQISTKTKLSLQLNAVHYRGMQATTKTTESLNPLSWQLQQPQAMGP